MARFPPGFIDDLKAQADIVQVVQEVVPLRRAGTSLKGLCPFHTEKTPSFTVSGDRGFFHCFGCGTGGDVIKFVQLHEHLTFPDAVLALAKRFGLQPPASDDPARDAAAESERETLLAVHELAGEYFRAALATPAAAGAREHLEERGVGRETSARLGLGFAPPQREGLKRRLLDAGHSLDILIKSGLVVERDGGRTADRFRNRLMIPICRDGGSVVAFGGRALAAGQQPKYLNSPETPLYAKGRTLYGLHLTKQAIRRLGYAVHGRGLLRPRAARAGGDRAGGRHLRHGADRAAGALAATVRVEGHRQLRPRRRGAERGRPLRRAAGRRRAGGQRRAAAAGRGPRRLCPHSGRGGLRRDSEAVAAVSRVRPRAGRGRARLHSATSRGARSCRRCSPWPRASRTRPAATGSPTGWRTGRA